MRPIQKRKELDYLPVEAGMRKDHEAKMARRAATKAAREERKARRQAAQEDKERLGREDVSLQECRGMRMLGRMCWAAISLAPTALRQSCERAIRFERPAGPLAVDPVEKIMAQYSEDVVYEDLTREQEAFVGWEEVRRYVQETKDNTPMNLRFIMDEMTEGEKACTVLWHVEGPGDRGPGTDAQFNSRLSPRGVTYYELNDEGKAEKPRASGALASAMEPKRSRVEKRARVVLCGAGSWAQGWHLPQLQRNPGAELVAIVDPASLTWSKYNPDIKPTRDLAAMYQVPVFKSFEEFLASDIAERTDGAIISSSHKSHHSIGLQAAAKLHILMEKPMTTDAREAKELAAAVRKSGKVFMVNHSANFRPEALRVRELIQSGRIGEVEHVTCSMLREREFFEDEKNRLWVSASEGSEHGNGFAWGQSCHTLAWVYWVAGLSPESVFCKMVRSKSTGADIFTSAIIQCTNGATITCEGLAGLPGGNAVAGAQKGKQIENKIFGSKGCLQYSGDDALEGSGRLEVRA
ncbi:unnamed protein product, partial [Effrenium voratum]